MSIRSDVKNGPRKREGYVGQFGNPANPRTSFHPSHLLVPCAACGASKGSRCRNREGAKLTGSHKVRAAKAEGA